MDCANSDHTSAPNDDHILEGPIGREYLAVSCVTCRSTYNHPVKASCRGAFLGVFSFWGSGYCAILVGGFAIRSGCSFGSSCVSHADGFELGVELYCLRTITEWISELC